MTNAKKKAELKMLKAMASSLVIAGNSEQAGRRLKEER